MTSLAAAAVVLVSAFVKGTIAVGFPTLGTPLLALVVDVKTAVVVLILPNIVMDAIQLARRGTPRATLRRLGWLLPAGAVGTIIGTRLLVVLPSRVVLLLLGVFVVIFVALNVSPVAPRVPSRWERWTSPLAGLAAGILGGITNVPGTPLAMYFYALGMAKREFVASVALTFLVYKVVQLGAVAWYGLLTWSRLQAAVGLTGVALLGFAVGLRVQDRLEQQAFNRAVLVFLALLGGWLVWRAL
jgi:uncharacterized membrane protein YfcA